MENEPVASEKSYISNLNYCVTLFLVLGLWVSTAGAAPVAIVNRTDFTGPGGTPTDFTTAPLVIGQSSLFTIHGEAVVSGNPGGQNDVHAQILVNGTPIKTSNQVSLATGFEGTLPYSYTGNFTAGDTVAMRFFSQTGDPFEFFNGDLNLIEFVPEPSTLALAAFGLLSLSLYGWRRRTRA